MQAESVDWYGSVSSNLEEFVGFDRAWLGFWRWNLSSKGNPQGCRGARPISIVCLSSCSHVKRGFLFSFLILTLFLPSL